ncbi:PH domain-containing protein [Listeria welshimeri]|uniref:Conserved membrane protein n=1 Tax=Listeria welshimeri serovar 6b (strain ATCC 35897 / DSM 20650 / CCUG 15529 / CIP 8149 / NCTC 11857 / SLCC 5334 / V8) TaxID=386043 RepID=A0AH01_LISW6|nr:PH domain-containing protein [Listeria welshimeri]MBC1652425.1 PH domain-containing protein [Listeria welshimeri]MBC1662793.1 PH domain-containing protein [Listeria welshimeri]MBC2081245.1 PH domain-containing protein [Listeria welshimeri]MBF2412666.1 PH domain-containing protein [Listeria welshimeri]CAK20283.1 conserved membrane protein [Listeria welshimeri serovar 6b str. SLCC5334]
MFEERRLHPIALIKEIITNIRRNIVPIVVGLFSVFRAINSRGYLPNWAVYLIIVIVVLLVLTPAVLKYITYKYTLEDQGIRIKYGLIFRKNTYIPYERIQTVQKKQWFFFIPFNVCQVLIETAGGNGKAEADLVAVPVGVVDELKDLRDGKKAAIQEVTPETEEKEVAEAEVEAPEKTVVLQTKQLILMAVTSGGVFGTLLIVLAFMQQFRDVIPTDWMETQAEQLWKMGIIVFIILIILLLLVLWGISIVTTLFKYFQFKLMKYPHSLVIEKGLLERNHTTISLARIQGITIIESPLRQMLGLVAVKVITAGNSGDEKQSGDILLLPIMKKDLALKTLKEMLPNYVFEIEEMERAPKSSLRRFLRIYLIWTIIPALVASIMFFPLGLVSFILPILAGIKAISSYRATGLFTHKHTLLVQSRPFISKLTHIIRKERIQGLSIRQSIWMEKGTSRHLNVWLKSGSTSTEAFVRYINKDQAITIHNWYSPSKTNN